MIDIRVLRNDPDLIRQSQNTRGADVSLVDEALAADEQRKTALSTFESLRAEQKAFGKKVAAAKGEEKKQLLDQVKQLAQDVKTADAAATQAQTHVDNILLKIDNVIAPDVPPGGEDDAVVLRTVGEPRDFAAEGFEPRDHLEIAEGLNALDMSRGAKVSGARFYFWTGVGARLELALLNMAMDRAISWGFTPMITPSLVRPDVMAGTGFLGEHSSEIYHLAADDLYLVGTSEVPLAGYHMDEIIDLEGGPKRYAGWSTCYRREAGSHGKDTRGIIRVHQFQKVEMFVYCSEQEAAAEHQRLLGWEEEMLQSLGLHYQVVNIAAGDLGSSAAQKFDCEGWVPSQGRFRELSSTSNCTAFQARRLNVRERSESGTKPVATLNGTLATTRWLVALLENHQQEDGSVNVPEALQPYLGGLAVLRPGM